MTANEAIIDGTVIVDAPIEVVSERILRPEVMERYMVATKVGGFEGARGGELGSEFHCHHGYGVNFLRVVASDKGRQVTLASTGPAGEAFITMRLASQGTERPACGGSGGGSSRQIRMRQRARSKRWRLLRGRATRR